MDVPPDETGHLIRQRASANATTICCRPMIIFFTSNYPYLGIGIFLVQILYPWLLASPYWGLCVLFCLGGVLAFWRWSTNTAGVVRGDLSSILARFRRAFSSGMHPLLRSSIIITLVMLLMVLGPLLPIELGGYLVIMIVLAFGSAAYSNTPGHDCGGNLCPGKGCC